MKKATLIIESEITDALINTGIPANVQGFHFLKEAIVSTIKQPILQRNLTKKLYPAIGDKYGVSSTVVERSMRSAIESAYKSDGLYGLNELLNTQYFTGKEKPCNGCYIALIAEIVKKNIYRMIATFDSDSDFEKQQLAKEIEESIGEISNDITA